MPQFIERPFPTAWSNFLSQKQLDRLQHSIGEYEERKQKQKTTGTVVGLVAGALGGLALAPAAVASAGAGSGFAAGTALTAAGTSALTGAIVPTLTGAALGSQIGGQLADKDYAGAIGTAATTAAGIVEYKENERLYGYQPTKEDKAAFGKLAIEAGTTLGDVAKRASQNGTTIGQELGVARETEQRRDVALAGEIEFEQTAAHLRANKAAALQSQLFDFEPDQAKLAQTQTDKEWIVENMRPPTGGGEPPISMEEGARMLAEVAQREDFLLSNPQRVPKKAVTMNVEGLGAVTEGQPRRVGNWQVSVEREKSGQPTVKWQQVPPAWMFEPDPAVRKAKSEQEAESQIVTVRGKEYRWNKDGTLDENKQDKEDGNDFKDRLKQIEGARKELQKEQESKLSLTDSEGKAIYPTLPDVTDQEVLDRVRKNKALVDQLDAPPPEEKPAAQARSAAALVTGPPMTTEQIESGTVENLGQEIEAMMNKYGSVEKMNPDDRAQFLSMVQLYRALGGG
jgi:hypothetical protein